MTMVGTAARAFSEIIDGEIVASVEIASPPERVFRAISSDEIMNWWVRPGVFDTREWSGDVRVGGRWRASGMARGAPYTLEGEYIEVDPPRKLVHTWRNSERPDAISTVTYQLRRIPIGTRLTVRHVGIRVPEIAKGTTDGWEASLRRLLEMLGV
jgi:uncharacterized protein YndB with AHSA1/START domain